MRLAGRTAVHSQRGPPGRGGGGGEGGPGAGEGGRRRQAWRGLAQSSDERQRLGLASPVVAQAWGRLSNGEAGVGTLKQEQERSTNWPSAEACEVPRGAGAWQARSAGEVLWSCAAGARGRRRAARQGCAPRVRRGSSNTPHSWSVVGLSSALCRHRQCGATASAWSPRADACSHAGAHACMCAVCSIQPCIVCAACGAGPHGQSGSVQPRQLCRGAAATGAAAALDWLG